MAVNPAEQYATDANLRARQRLWERQRPKFDLTAWVLDAAGVGAATPRRVLDVGCGNGAYLRALRRRGVDAVGCDLSPGMLRAARPHRRLVAADVTALPFPSSAFAVVLAPHMLYHVPDRVAAVRELRRVLAPGGRCVAVTNGRGHLRALRTLVEAAVRAVTPGWEMRDPATHAFSLENGEAQLRTAFDHVECVRPAQVPPVVLTEADEAADAREATEAGDAGGAAVAADYVASVADHYQSQTARPWADVVEDVRTAVRREIEAHGAFTVSGDTGLFLCR